METDRTTAFVPITLAFSIGDIKSRDSEVQSLLKEIMDFIKTRNACFMSGLVSYPGTLVTEGIYQFAVNFVIWGTPLSVTAARGELLRIYVSQVRLFRFATGR